MENVKQFLIDEVANAKLKVVEQGKPKIEQRTRNALKKQLMDIMVTSLENTIGCDVLTIVRTEKGVGIAVDNESVGIIPIELTLMFKDLDNDILDMNEEYQEKLRIKAEKAEQAKKAKASKIARQKELTLAKQRLKDLQNQEPAPQDDEDF